MMTVVGWIRMGRIEPIARYERHIRKLELLIFSSFLGC